MSVVAALDKILSTKALAISKVTTLMATMEMTKKDLDNIDDMS